VSRGPRILVIAGVSSGVGKTTLTLGLLETLVHLHFGSTRALADAFVAACAS